MLKAAIVIPVFNQEPFLERSLRSLLDQTCGDFAAFCVNDGSTDASAGVLLRLAAEDGRIRVVDKPNGGVSSARNAGLAAALADRAITHVMFLDADDAYRPDCVKTALETAAAHPDAIVEWDWDDRVRERSTSIWSKCYPRAVVEDVRFFEGANVAEDIAFNLEVFFRHRPALVHVARRLYDYSENPVSAMHRTLSADDFRQRVALIEYLVSVFASDQAILADMIRTEIPDLLRQFRRQLRRVRPSDRDLAQDLFRTELAALRRRGLLRPRRGGVRGFLDYCRGLLMSMGK